MTRLLALAAALLFLTLPSPSQAQPSKKPAPPAAAKAPTAPVAQGKLAFVSTTGLEDLQTLSASLRHAKLAKESGYLSEVVWLSVGRSASILDPKVKGVPDSIRQELAQAEAAGVKLEVCNNTLTKLGIDPGALEPKAKVVPAGAVEMARLVAEGYQLIRY